MTAVESRARVHAALALPVRLELVDALALGDRTVGELGELSGLPSNLLAHHLDVLDDAGLILRRRSEGDRRRRYVSLLPAAAHLIERPHPITGRPLFVCTHNSARSQFAAALWSTRTGTMAQSAGTHPAFRVHPKAVAVAAELGVELDGAFPKGYDQVAETPDLVISVCDRAGEAPPPRTDVDRLHWSIPDPVLAGTTDAFRRAFVEIAERVERLTAAAP